jgi:hypothetical protein
MGKRPTNNVTIANAVTQPFFINHHTKPRTTRFRESSSGQTHSRRNLTWAKNPTDNVIIANAVTQSFPSTPHKPRTTRFRESRAGRNPQ